MALSLGKESRRVFHPIFALRPAHPVDITRVISRDAESSPWTACSNAKTHTLLSCQRQAKRDAPRAHPTHLA